MCYVLSQVENCTALKVKRVGINIANADKSRSDIIHAVDCATFDNQSCHTSVYHHRCGSGFRPPRNASFRSELLFEESRVADDDKIARARAVRRVFAFQAAKSKKRNADATLFYRRYNRASAHLSVASQCT